MCDGSILGCENKSVEYEPTYTLSFLNRLIFIASGYVLQYYCPAKVYKSF